MESYEKILGLERTKRLYLNSVCVSERMWNIYNIFVQCFGEDHIELTAMPQIIPSHYKYSIDTKASYDGIMSYYRNYIVIKVDREVVKNELGMSTTIYDLFVRLHFRIDGRLLYCIEYKKSTFTRDQLFSGYIHSHCTRLDTRYPENWHSVCTGNGPINNTMSVLGNSQSAVELYYGFIAELRQIIRVESIAGGPYIQIQQIIGPHVKVKEYKVTDVKLTTIEIQLLRSYIKSKRLKVGFVSNKFCLGCTFVEWLIDFSEYAKAWATANHKTLPFTQVVIKDGHICRTQKNYNEEDFNKLIGKPVIVFKGTTYNLKVIDQNSGSEERRQVVNPQRAATIIKRMLDILNYWYEQSGNKNATFQ